MNRLILVLLLGATVVLSVIYGGLVLSWLWLWFVVPLGMRPIGVAEAIGLSCIASIFRQHMAADEDYDWVAAMLRSALGETFLLVLGLFVHLFT